MDIAPADLGREIDLALCDYLPEGEPIYADEWEKRDKRLLEYFGEKS
ncbi:MAG: hypothetical protein GY862_11605, partial [Gammaproteobacteria bacterium]|nr:hypothetical protein [Gammaproteobacteria bacterium]